MKKLEIHEVNIYHQTIAPAISFSVTIAADSHTTYCYLITGELLCGEKVVSFLNTIHQNFTKNQKGYFELMLVAELDERKVDFLENERQKSNGKSVKLEIKLSAARIQPLTIKSSNNFSTPQVSQKIAIEELRDSTEISQNDWLNKFSSKLGIGEFYLVELIKPQPKSGNGIWSDLHEMLIRNLNEMEAELKKGDWQRTMEISRRFYENIKIGGKKKEDIKYKKDLSKRMMDLQFDEEGVGNLFHGVWKFFDFTSKFVHETDKNGQSKPIPNAKKEDAYFIYSLSLNLTNLIYEKIKTTS